MAMRIFSVLLLLLASIVHPVNAAHTDDSDMRAKRPPVIELRGTRIEGGVPGTFVEIVDLANGYSSMTVHSGVSVSQSGFDGMPWGASDGRVARIDYPEDVKLAHAYAYVARVGWLEGARMPAVTLHKGGDGRVSSVSIATDIGPETIQLSRWETVDGVQYPFLQTDTDGTGAQTILRVTHLRIVSPAASAFAPPKPVNHGFIAGTQPATVPFSYISARDSHILVNASIENHPARLIFDTGGANYFGTDAAKTWGLTVSGGANIGGAGSKSISVGFARIRSMKLGAAELRDQTAVIAPLPWPPSRGPNSADGITGFEYFAAFRTTIDYHRKVLEFSSFDTPDAHAGTKLPFVSDGHHIFITASVNNVSGLFDVDTGAGGGITLFKHFADRAAVNTNVKANASGGGVGGTIRLASVRLPSFSIAGHQISNAKAQVSLMRTGYFASTGLAGNLGGRFLRCFVLTIDYRARTILFGDHPETAACLAALSGR